MTNYNEQLEKVLTSKRTTKEIQEQLALLYKLRKQRAALEQEIENVCDRLCLKIDSMLQY